MSTQLYIHLRDHVPQDIVFGVLARCGAIIQGSPESRIPGVGRIRVLDLRREAMASEAAGIESFYAFHPRTSVLLSVERCTDWDPCDDAVVLATMLWMSCGSDVDVAIDMELVIRIERDTLTRASPGFQRLTVDGAASLDALWTIATRRGRK